jgi:hypothetical protein
MWARKFASFFFSFIEGFKILDYFVAFEEWKIVNEWVKLFDITKSVWWVEGVMRQCAFIDVM